MAPWRPPAEAVTTRAACRAWPCETRAITDQDDHTTNGHGDDQPDEPNEPDERDEKTGSGFERWRRESALGAAGTGIAKGLRNVFAPSDDHQVIVAEVPGDPPDASERVRVILDPDDPTKSVAYVPKPAGQEDETPPDGSVD